MKIRIRIFICFFLVCFSVFSQNNPLNGSWEGKIQITPQVSLRLVLNVTTDNEVTSVTMDSPDQGAYGIPVNVNFLDNDSINVSQSQLGVVYKGKLENGNINGIFSQGALTLPLILSPKLSVKRPQTPQPPFSYKVENVTFPSCLDDGLLNGSLTLPSDFSYQSPVAVLVSGSGTQNRDEELFEHKPFAVLADYLANKGIATLRYDDRGFDKTTGLQPNSTTYENAMDAKGAIEFLRKRGFSDIGVIGHSEGGLIADMLGSDNNNGLRFIVEIGGPAVAGDSILVYQNEFLLSDGGMPAEYVSMYIDAMKGLFDSQKDINPIPFDEKSYSIFSDENSTNPVLAPLAKNLKDNFYSLSPWIKYFINYNPLNDIKTISIPMLFIYGEKDTQVPPILNVPILEQNIPNAVIKVFPNLNHMMQHCVTGKITEYADIEETIAEEVLEEITSFILSTKN